MEDFSRTLRIKTHQVDAFLRLKGSALLNIFQEISVEQTELMGYRRDKSLDRGLLWVILKEVIDIHRMPLYDEAITIYTYPNKRMHNIFPRSYYIKDEKGEVIVEGKVLWALIDINNRKMIDPIEHGIDIPDLSNNRPFKMPFNKLDATCLDKEVSLKALYSYCDLNGHINNTRYLDIAMDLLPLDLLKERPLKRVDIEYHHEIKLGEEFLVKYGNNNNIYYFASSPFRLELVY